MKRKAPAIVVVLDGLDNVIARRPNRAAQREWFRSHATRQERKTLRS